MRLTHMARAAFGMALAGATLAACSSSGSQLTPGSSGLLQSRSHVPAMRVVNPTGAIQVPALHTTVAPNSLPGNTDLIAGKIYVSDYSSNTIDIYPAAGKNQKPTGTITNGISGPLGTCVDGAGTLYVANISNNTVTSYLKGQTTPAKTFSVAQPIGCVVDGKGTLYIAAYAQNLITEFDKGANSPSRTISINNPEGLWLDNALHLYASYNGTDGMGHVMEFNHKATTGTDLGITVSFAGDVRLDPSGNLLLGDQINLVIQVYAPGTTTPARTLNLNSNSPYKFTFNKSATLLDIAAYNTDTVPIFKYSSDSQVNTLSGLASVYGVSFSPHEPYGTPF